MDHYTSSCVTLQSFDQIYTNAIRPKLEAIDLFLKSSEAPFSNREAASVLGVTHTELLNTMKENEYKNTLLSCFILSSSIKNKETYYENNKT